MSCLYLCMVLVHKPELKKKNMHHMLWWNKSQISTNIVSFLSFSFSWISCGNLSPCDSRPSPPCHPNVIVQVKFIQLQCFLFIIMTRAHLLITSSLVGSKFSKTNFTLGTRGANNIVLSQCSNLITCTQVKEYVALQRRSCSRPTPNWGDDLRKEPWRFWRDFKTLGKVIYR